jgi:hypothetical protein
MFITAHVKPPNDQTNTHVRKAHPPYSPTVIEALAGFGVALRELRISRGISMANAAATQ